MATMGKIGTAQEFRHSELRSETSIRLIRIHAELFRGDISCTLRHYESDTQTCPDYIALSYVWGDSTPTHTIYINGLVYRVHQSLWEFLSHVQSKEETERRWFWTDLLCIDQAHHSEKNEQISRMGDIYAQAALVTSWLGNCDKTVEALRILVDISEGIGTGCEPKYAWRSSESEQIHRACDQLAFQEPYWERVWILQEVACARDCIVACGDISVNFEDLLHRMEIAMRRSVRYDNLSDRDRTMKRMKALADLKTSIQQRKTINILKLIDKTSFCQAKRDQDRIYGLLGLASRLDPGFDPNALEISQHKTLIDVWWDIIFMILDKEQDISRIKNDMGALDSLIGILPPPRKQWMLEMGSRSRRAHAETASQVSEAAYSSSIQAVIGILPRYIRDDTAFRSQQWLRGAWDSATKHVYTNERHVPGLQTSLGWSTYAGLRFTAWHDVGEKALETLAHSLPSGWFCAAHLPGPISKITTKHLITSSNHPPKYLSHEIYCSGEGNDEARCDLSLVVLKIKQLGITCLVRSNYEAVGINFYCDCCDPSLASSR